MCFANKEKVLINRMSRVKSKAQIEVCGDCGASDPSWASINRGILLCSECCSVHRSLGRHISQVKSLRQGSWSPSVLNFVNSINAHGANSVWEHCLLDAICTSSSSASASGSSSITITGGGGGGGSGSNKQLRRKPNSKDPLHPVKSEFIKAKHVNLAYVLKPNVQQLIDDDSNNVETELSKQLHASVRTSNLETSLRLIVQGADPNFFHEEKRSTPLHVAAKFGQVSQVELLIVYGAEINVVDGNGLTPVEVAKNNKHNLIAERLIEAMYEVTDRISLFLGGKKPNHSSGKHLIIPEQNSSEISEQLKIARGKLQLVPNKMFEELVMDLYDEVDRRENEAIWTTSSLNPEIGGVPFLPANPYLSATRNQGRQKLARFSPNEFAGLLTDVLIDAKRRQNMANLRPTINSITATSNPTTTDNNMMMMMIKNQRRQQNDKNISDNDDDDDEPLYDAVASDDDYAALTPIAQKTTFNQSSTTTTTPQQRQHCNEVESLRKQLMEYMFEISQLKTVVHKLSTENSELKSKMCDTTATATPTTTTTITKAPQTFAVSTKNHQYLYDIPLRIDLNGIETETEPVLDDNDDSFNDSGINNNINNTNNSNTNNNKNNNNINNNVNNNTNINNNNHGNSSNQSTIKRPVSMYETRLGPYTKPPEYRTTASMYQMAAATAPHQQQQQSTIDDNNKAAATAIIDYFQPFGEEVKHRTNLVTRRLKELCIAMQQQDTSSNKDAFVPCAERIRVAVAELIAIFSTQTNCNEHIKGAIKQLNLYTGLIQRECDNLQKSLSSDNVATIDECMQDVRDCALQLASATKTLVMQFQ